MVISFGIASLVSLLAALCYAEMASAVPTAGSAYTDAYATIGEIFAWIIGWDLILEFALGAAVVAHILVVVKVAICAFVIIAGLFFLNRANLTPFVPPAEPVEEGTSGLALPLSQAVFGLEPTAFGFAGVLTAAAGPDRVLDGPRPAAPAVRGQGPPQLGNALPHHPAPSAVACLYLMTNLSIETWLRIVAWMAIGVVLYFAYGRRNARLADRERTTA